jgi:hypothetical protein
MSPAWKSSCKNENRGRFQARRSETPILGGQSLDWRRTAEFAQEAAASWFRRMVSNSDIFIWVSARYHPDVATLELDK